MMWFKCKHPLEKLGVEKEQTIDSINADFEHVTYHLYCHDCKKQVSLKYAQLRGGVVKFFNRGEK